jgi:DNA polymerase-3 subunit gamma/tau
MQLTIDLRPHNMSEVYGHPLIAKSLYNRAKDKSWPTATLLKGFSGTGKTTVAQILANMINCENPSPSGDPCNVCLSCQSVNSGRFDRDIQVLNGTVDSGKKDVTDAISNPSSVPFYDQRHNVLIIEEADGLSKSAKDALLKALESPTTNTHFILLSMVKGGLELPNTSRCQTLNFAPFFKKDILLGLQTDLKRIGKWGIPEIPKSFYLEVLPAIASASGGSYRQALQDVESCLYGEAWTPEQYTELTGKLDADGASDILMELIERKKGFFLSLEKVNFQEFFNTTYNMLSQAYAYSKTGVMKDNFFEDQIKALSTKNIAQILGTYSKIYEASPGYTKKDHAVACLAQLY